MILHCKSYPNLYKDSVSLMQVSAKLNALEGVKQASVAMATDANIERMRDAGMAVEVSAKPNDLLIALIADQEAGHRALALADELLLSANSAGDRQGIVRRSPSSIAMGVERQPESNLALISVPGRYAAAEALKALKLGLHVMLFSDNVPECEEVDIKRYATAHDLLVMGPDCGTAIVNGLPLGFANAVRRGAIGLVAASGTGLQEVSCRIHHLGEGVSQALGTGGRDLHEEIGGQSMLQAIKMLAEDPETKLIVLISKPPSQAVTENVLSLAGRCGKPVVVHFLGAEPASLERYGVIPAQDLQNAADTAVAVLRGASLPTVEQAPQALCDQAMADIAHMAVGQTDIRGVFAGGTFCYEAQLALIESGLACESNAPVKGASELKDPARGHGHSLVDMGDDQFTQSRPHPMIDPTLRNARLLQEAAAPSTAGLLFDIVLGYGASLNPTEELLPILAEARQQAQRQGRRLLLIAHVCGTENDPQPRQQQIDALRQAGVLVAQSNVQAARLAAFVAQQRK
ncbi:membrane protein FdrA [Leminorella richardii]|uniref:Membrane protein FdrA n=1 Tax=Leminorella richardii TaxID=158841 RepID=A0A2X4UIP6_9GAMM|nr:acyl-CoA synthetase FdrA [Leminorella richardii]SQI39697.1 membrane protein FdrA [Leminorella richardii]